MTEPSSRSTEVERTWLDDAAGWSLVMSMVTVPLAITWMTLSESVLPNSNPESTGWLIGLLPISLLPAAAVVLAHVSYAAPSSTWSSPLRAGALAAGYGMAVITLGAWLILITDGWMS